MDFCTKLVRLLSKENADCTLGIIFESSSVNCEAPRALSQKYGTFFILVHQLPVQKIQTDINDIIHSQYE